MTLDQKIEALALLLADKSSLPDGQIKVALTSFATELKTGVLEEAGSLLHEEYQRALREGGEANGYAHAIAIIKQVLKPL